MLYTSNWFQTTLYNACDRPMAVHYFTPIIFCIYLHDAQTHLVVSKLNMEQRLRLVVGQIKSFSLQNFRGRIYNLFTYIVTKQIVLLLQYKLSIYIHRQQQQLKLFSILHVSSSVRYMCYCYIICLYTLPTYQYHCFFC